MTTDRQEQRRASSWKRTAVLAGFACVVLGVLAGGGLLLGRRFVAEAAIQRQLRAFGAEGLEFRVVALGSGGSQITDLRVPDGAARVAAVGVSYSLGRLAELELRAAQIEGVDFPIHRQPTGWRVPLATWIGQLRLPVPDPATPASFHVTVPSVTIDGVIRLVHHRLGEWRLPARAELAVSPERLAGSGGIQMLGDEQRFEVAVTPELDGEVRLAARLANPAAFHTLCSYADLPLPFELLPGGEGVTVVVVVKLCKGEPTAISATATVGNARLRWQGHDFSAGSLRLAARSALPALAEWGVEATAVGLGGFGAVVPELVCTMSGSASDGTLTVRKAQFRRGDVAGTAAGEVRWHEGQRLDGDLRIARLAVGGLAVEGALLKAKGTREAMDWELTWGGESGVYGLRNVALAGRASLVGDPSTTIGGKAIISLDGMAKAVGQPGLTGELSLDVAEETTLRFGGGGLVWQGKLEGNCAELATRVGQMRGGVSGLRIAFAGEGTPAAADFSVRTASLSGFLESKGMRVTSTGNRVQVAANGITLTDLLALAEQPLAALPKTSQAKLVLEIGHETLAMDLAEVATYLGGEGQMAGKAVATNLASKAAWTTEGVSLEASVSGSLPELSLAPFRGLRLRLPTEFQLRVSGSPERMVGRASCNGENVGVALGKAAAKAATWRGDVAFSGLSLAALPGLPAHLLQGHPMPEGGELRLSGTLGGVACDLATWAPLITSAASAGQLELRTAEFGLVLNGEGLAGEAAVSGKGRGLRTALPDAGTVGGTADFSVKIKGSPAALSGSADFVLADARWQQGDVAFAADNVRTVVSCVDLPAALALSLVGDPLGTRNTKSAAKASASLAVTGGELTGAGSLSGISLSGEPVRWTSRDGWQTEKEGVRFEVGEAKLRGLHVQKATGKISLAGAELQWEAALPLIGPGVTARVEGKGELSPRLSLRGSLTVPAFTMSTDQGWVLGLGDLGGLEFSAKVDARADVEWVDGRLGLGLDLGLGEGKFTLPEGAGEVTGVATRLALAVLPEFRSRAHQKLAFASARVGELAFGEGEVFYRLDGPRLLFLESVVVGWCEGELETHALRFDADRTDLEGTIYAREIDVGEFAQVFPGVKGTGQGQLYGRLPVFRRQGRVGYGEGFLYCIPGEHGFLQLSALGMLAPILVSMGPRGGVVADSLTDFDYSLFRVDIRPKGHEQEGIRVRLIGAKANQKDAQPVHLDVNINGAIVEALNVGVKVGTLKQIFENAEWLQQALKTLIE